MDRELMDKIKREEIIPFIEEYYASIGRTNVPDYKNYSLTDLKKCLHLFGIHLKKEGKPKKN